MRSLVLAALTLTACGVEPAPEASPLAADKALTNQQLQAYLLQVYKDLEATKAELAAAQKEIETLKKDGIVHRDLATRNILLTKVLGVALTADYWQAIDATPQEGLEKPEGFAQAVNGVREGYGKTIGAGQVTEILARVDTNFAVLLGGMQEPDTCSGNGYLEDLQLSTLRGDLDALRDTVSAAITEITSNPIYTPGEPGVNPLFDPDAGAALAASVSGSSPSPRGKCFCSPGFEGPNCE